jgi:hypothetical protein
MCVSNHINKSTREYIIRANRIFDKSGIIEISENKLFWFNNKIYKNTKNVYCNFLSDDMRGKFLSISPCIYKISNMIKYLSHIEMIFIVGDSFNNTLRITKFPKSFEKLSNLQALCISKFEYIEKLPKQIFNLKNLRILQITMADPSRDFYMSNNTNDLIGLQKISSKIGKLTNLEILNLNNNSLCKLPHTIKNLTKLSDLCIDYNRFSQKQYDKYKKILCKKLKK